MTPTNLKKLVKIAEESIPELEGRGDLEARNSDSEDFFETSVWSLKEALRAAFEYGKEIGAKTGKVSPPRNYHGDL
jgi:hypothetical protein